MNKFIKNSILKSFFKIKLTWNEKGLAIDSIESKYTPSVKKGLFYWIISFPSILLLDINVIASVLIPITLVAWSAWFSISLASMKKKFERFWLELTKNIFEAFITSLILLILISWVSLYLPFLWDLIEYLQKNNFIMFSSSTLWFYVIIQIVYNIFIWSLKYDVNDAMLSGQNESAEKFYKKSLSLLQITSKNLREWNNTEWNSLDVSNYYIWVSFYEVFTYASLFIKSKNITSYIDKTNKLINNPSMEQKEADNLSKYLIKNFINLLDKKNNDILKNMNAIEDELKNLINNVDIESQKIIDIRISVILEEIWEMIDNHWENLFIK